MSDVPSIVSFEDLLKELKKCFNDENVDVGEVKAVLSAYDCKKDDGWKRYVHFEEKRYTRNLVDAGNGKYNVIVLCWNRGHASKIHDHSNSNCFVKVLDGDLKETLFSWPISGTTNGPELKQEQVYEPNQVTYINDGIGLHRMENWSKEKGTVSLHVYVPAFDSCQTFDAETGKAAIVPMSFYSVNGDIVEGGENANQCSRVASCCSKE